jgi:hypothetical protein
MYTYAVVKERTKVDCISGSFLGGFRRQKRERKHQRIKNIETKKCDLINIIIR